MRGDSAEGVAARVLSCPGLQGLQGPTVSPVYAPDGSNTFSATICVPKAKLYASVKALRSVRHQRPGMGALTGQGRASVKPCGAWFCGCTRLLLCSRDAGQRRPGLS